MNQITFNVRELFVEKYIEMTKALSCVELKEVLPFELDNDCISGRVKTKSNAPYDLVLLCCISQELATQIVRVMSKEEDISKEDIIMYIREYINITSGRIVSTINNQIGKSARFGVPEIQNQKTDSSNMAEYKNYTSVFFRSEYGEMILNVAYTIDDILVLAGHA